METELNLLISLQDNPRIKDTVLDLITSNKFDEPVQLSNDVSVSLEVFISLFIEGLHQQTQWLLKDEVESKSQKSSQKKSKSKNQSNSSSPEKCVPTDDKKQRSRVKLFSSPLRDENSLTSPIFLQSTPKQIFNRSSNSSDSLTSPLWPNRCSPPPPYNYNRRDFSTSSPGSNQAQDDSWSRRSKISLGDFIVKDSPNIKKRRIKPTKVVVDVNEPTDGPFGLESPVAEKSSSLDERIISKMDAVMLEQNESSKVSNVKVTSAETAVKKTYTPPVYNEQSVTNPQFLETLAEIFGLVISKNHCENLMNELYFLCNLTTAGNVNNSTVPSQLNSVHNCAYFAVMTLTKIRKILCLLTSTTLGLLAVQPAVAYFAPNLKTDLENLSREKLNKSAQFIHVPQGGNVSFQCDTDNVENFTSHLSFSSFRKQRDALYALLHTWEKCHNDNGFNFKKSMTSKVRSILAIKDDATNILHFARLFRNQLLASCTIYGTPLDEAEEEVLELLPTADRDRLSRLQARLVEPSTKRGPVPKPDFPGRQLFFKDFIIACGPGMFTHFLQLCFVDELLRLNDFELSTDGCDSFADDLTQKRYLENVSSTRLLAKFLAFVEFLPYYCCETLSEQVMNLHCAARERALPLFDLDCCLQDAVRNHRLVLTLPWIVAYLSVMDCGTTRLLVYAKVWRHLFWLRRQLPEYITPMGRFMLQLSLGWLFQISKISDISEETLEFVGCEKNLDDIDVVSDVVLNHVCPFLNELNNVLTGNSANSGRHIRPTLTKPSGDHVKQLELRLEESFLQNQSQSTRRTVQFVSERVASCCIKEMNTDILPKIKETIKQEFLQDSTTNKSALNVELFLKKWSTEVKAATATTALEICKNRASQSLRGLLWRDVDEAVIDNAIAIVTRQSLEKVKNWLQNNEQHMKIISTNLLEVETPEANYSVEYLPDCLNILRNVVIKVQSGQVTEAELLEALNLCQMILTTQTLPPSTERGLLCMLVELLTEIAVGCIKINHTTWKYLACIIRLANSQNHISNPLERLFCERNLLFPTKELMYLPVFLVDEGLITKENALEQAKNCPTGNLSVDVKEELLNTINVLEQQKS